MFAKLKHVATVSENYTLVGRFYEAVFKMRTSGRARPESAVVVGDGYIGLNINPRRAGRQAGFDYLGSGPSSGRPERKHRERAFILSMLSRGRSGWDSPPYN